MNRHTRGERVRMGLDAIGAHRRVAGGHARSDEVYLASLLLCLREWAEERGIDFGRADMKAEEFLEILKLTGVGP